MKKLLIILSVTCLVGLTGCNDVKGFRIGKVGFGSMATPRSSAPSKPENTTVKLTQSADPRCQGISVTGAGRRVFRKMVPYLFVDLKNEGQARRSVTLDVEFRRQGKNLYGKYDESFWKTKKDIIIRPGDHIDVTIAKASEIKNLSIISVLLAECR